MIPFADAKAIGVREDPTTLFVAAVMLVVLGRFLPDIARWVWAALHGTGQRGAFLLGLALVLASVLPEGAGRQFFTSIAVLMIMIYALWIMVGGLRRRR